MTAELGAYGLRLPGLPGRRWLTPVPDDWPPWSFVHAPEVADVRQFVSGDHARLGMQPIGVVEIDRANRTTTVCVSERPPAEAWVHPIIGSTAAIAAEWAGRLVFHAGSFLDLHGRAWGILGSREHGKSTALAWLAANAHSVFGDDLLITDGRQAFAGPRCIDLRQGAAERFDLGVDIGVIGTRRRWRVDLPAIKPVASLAGMIVLHWSDDISFDLLPIDARAAAVRNHSGLRISQAHPLPWLRLLAGPVISFGRPCDWRHIDRAMAKLMEFATSFVDRRIV